MFFCIVWRGVLCRAVLCRPVYPVAEVAAAVLGMMDKMGVRKACFVAHSYGECTLFSNRVTWQGEVPSTNSVTSEAAGLLCGTLIR
jgi:hypothetical protein